MLKRKSTAGAAERDIMMVRDQVDNKLAEIAKKEDQRGDDERAASIDAIETVQVIAALLAGTGIAFLDDVNKSDPGPLSEWIRFFVLIFVGLNLYGLVVLSSSLFYLRQCMAKDIGMFDPFMDATKDLRYWALKGVLYSMVSCVAVVGLRQFQNAEKSIISKIGGVAFMALAFYCLHVMWSIRQSFASLRRKSKAKKKLKAGGHAMVMINKMKLSSGREKGIDTVTNVTDMRTEASVSPVTPSPSRRRSIKDVTPISTVTLPIDSVDTDEHTKYE